MAWEPGVAQFAAQPKQAGTIRCIWSIPRTRGIPEANARLWPFGTAFRGRLETPEAAPSPGKPANLDFMLHNVDLARVDSPLFLRNSQRFSKNSPRAFGQSFACSVSGEHFDRLGREQPFAPSQADEGR